MFNIYEILYDYEKWTDLESKIVNMIDKVHSTTTFIKYEGEKHVDIDDVERRSCLRQYQFVVQKMSEGKDLTDIFYEFHMMTVKMFDAECNKYGITGDETGQILGVIRGFAGKIYE